MTRHPLRHGDRVAYATGPSKRKLEFAKRRDGSFDMGTVVVSGGGACVIWDDAEVSVDGAATTGLLWEEGHASGWFRDGCAYAVVTAESRRTPRAERQWRAARAKRRLDRYCARPAG